jgi:hypothetical protein
MLKIYFISIQFTLSQLLMLSMLLKHEVRSWSAIFSPARHNKYSKLLRLTLKQPCSYSVFYSVNRNLYHSFLSPFADVPCRLQDVDFLASPTEYLVNAQIKDKLAPIDTSRYSDDTLFYLFYMCGGDLIQLQAAAALYDRDWRYHIEKKVWLTKVPGVEPLQKMNNFEKGYYTIFDASQWRKIQAEMTIEYCKLAEKTQIAPQLLLQQQQLQQQLLASNNQNAASSILPVMLQQQLQQQQLQQQQQHAYTAALNQSASLASLSGPSANDANPSF